MQMLVAACLSLVFPQEQLFPNPSLATGEMFGAADLTGDGVPDVYGQQGITVSDGDFGEAWAFDYPGGQAATDALHGDYDGDGDFDLLIARSSLSLMRFDPVSAAFLYSKFIVSSTHYNLSLGDIDSDGKLDVVSTAWSSTLVRALLGNGVSGITAEFSSPLGLESREHRLGDVNQDGELDFVGSVIEGGFAIALGAGDGTFAAPLQLAPVLRFKELALADFDADGLLDLASAAEDAGYLWPGDGQGGFLAPTVVDGIGPFHASPFGPPFHGAHVQAYDLDGSGALDVVIGGQELGVFSHLVALYGDGAGGFTGTQQFPLGSYGLHFAFGDFDTDGDDDLALNSITGIAGCTVFFERVGDELAAPEPLATNPVDPFGPALWSFVALGDLDGDGDYDLATGGHSLFGPGTCKLGINDGTGGFTLSDAPPLSVTPGSARVTDLAGDGVPDLVIFPSAGIPLAPPTVLSIHTSDGQGGFLPEVLETLEHGAIWTSQGHSSHELADWTGDGRPDLWMPEGGIYLFPGQTTPSFAPPVFSFLPDGPQLKYAKPSPVDLDLDGDLDAVVSKQHGLVVELQTMLGDGAGSFTPLQSFPLEPVTQYDHSTAGDFDLDGWADAVTSSSDFFHGVGGGLLAEQGKLFDVDLEALDTADLNGDGALDVLAQNGRVLLGGPGGLSAPKGFYRPATWFVAAGDVDGGGADLFALESGLVLLRGSNHCAGSFEAYGGGCLGSNGSTPTLTGSGCPAPGGAFFLDVAQGLPGTVAYASFGLGKGSVPLPNGCTLLMSPWLPIFVPLHLDGAGAGSVGIAVAPTSPVDVTLTAQVGLFDPSAPGLFTLTNGLAITVK